jgi:hypothetical protein
MEGPRVEEIATEKVNLAVADGSTMDAFVARPKSHGKYAGILVFQEAFGVTAHIRNIAERFARIGLVAIAPELFHRAAPGIEIKYDDLPAAMQYARASTTDQLILDIKSAYQHWLLHGGPRFVSRLREGASAGSHFLLRRRHCAVIAAPHRRASRADFIFLGWPG